MRVFIKKLQSMIIEPCEGDSLPIESQPSVQELALDSRDHVRETYCRAISLN